MIAIDRANELVAVLFLATVIRSHSASAIPCPAVFPARSHRVHWKSLHVLPNNKANGIARRHWIWSRRVMKRARMELADTGQLGFEERFALLVDRQWLWKENRALARRNLPGCPGHDLGSPVYSAYIEKG